MARISVSGIGKVLGGDDAIDGAVEAVRVAPPGMGVAASRRGPPLPTAPWWEKLQSR